MADMDPTKPCYGEMFPDLDRLEPNQPLAGKAFEVLLASRGIGVSARRAAVRPEGWEACTACAHYRDCYDLSMARLALATALENRT